MNPNITILLLTYLINDDRIDYTKRTIQGLTHIEYDGKIGIYMAEGSGNGLNGLPDLLSQYTGSIKNWRVIGGHSEKLAPGANWNHGLVECYKHSDYILVMEDDWYLPESFDLTPYVGVLENHPEVGMIRFGTLTVGMKMECVGYDNRHFLKMSHECQYAFSGNPHLRHKRLNQKVGLYNENITPSPGDVEIDFDYRFRQQNELSIIRPADLPGYGIFRHIGTVQSYK